MLGITTLPLALARTWIPLTWITASIAIVAAANLPAWNVGEPMARLLAAIVVAVGTGLLLLRLRLPSRRPPKTVAGIALFAVAGTVVAAGWIVQDRYLRHRYASGGLTEIGHATYRLVRDVTGARIAVTGFVTHYPLYGADLSNRVEYPLEVADRGEFHPITTCSSWRRALRQGTYGTICS